MALPASRSTFNRSAGTARIDLLDMGPPEVLIATLEYGGERVSSPARPGATFARSDLVYWHRETTRWVDACDDIWRPRHGERGNFKLELERNTTTLTIKHIFAGVLSVITITLATGEVTIAPRDAINMSWAEALLYVQAFGIAVRDGDFR